AGAEDRPTATTSAPCRAGRGQRLEEVMHWWRQTRRPGDRPDDEPPHFLPFGQPPLSAYAEAVVAGVDDHVRHLLFSTYFIDHEDIGNPDLLRRLLAIPMIHGRSGAAGYADQGYAVAIGGG